MPQAKAILDASAPVAGLTIVDVADANPADVTAALVGSAFEAKVTVV
jgi:hypothetical protein